MTIFLHVNNKTFKALCQVTNTDDCLLMGRALAKTMGYIDYPDIKPPTKMCMQAFIMNMIAQQ